MVPGVVGVAASCDRASSALYGSRPRRMSSLRFWAADLRLNKQEPKVRGCLCSCR